MRAQRGFSLIEVLVTIIVLAFGLLGFAGLQARTASMEMESYQRSQGLVLLNDMVSRLELRVEANGTDYVTDMPLGTGDSQPASCGGTVPGIARDQCEWSNALKGAAETTGSGNVGAMIDARGCVTQIQAPNPATGVCAPGIYEVAVAWQGILETVAPNSDCGAGLYSSEAARRVVTMRVSAATVSCS